jgi:PEP-CTERM motif
MQFTHILKKVAAAALVVGAGSAMAVPISVGFNFIGFGTVFTGNGAGGDISTSTLVSASGGLGYVINGIDAVATTNNIGVALGGAVTLTDPMPLTLGGVFEKSFTAGGFNFVESLTVTNVSSGAGNRSILATGTITCGGVGVCGFDDTSVFFSASYTQNGGPTGQINASFNNSTVPPRINVPEPGTMALVGLALAGLGLSARRRKA